MVNKKAQSMSLTTILLMVLGIVVVVLLIWGFSTGWSGFWDRISPFGSKANVDSIRSGCKLACASSDQYNFCEKSQTVKFDDGTSWKGSCYNFMANSKVGVEGCSIECSVDKLPKKCEGTSENSLEGKWQEKACDTTLDEEDVTSKVGNTDGKNDNKYCCIQK